MNIAIDILHISYWNFYKNIIDKLERNNHKVYILIRTRGPLLKVVRKEYAKHKNILITGCYYHGRKKIFLHILRIPVLLFFLIKYKIDVVSSDGFFIGVASKVLRIPSIMHSDDFEYRLSYKMTQLFSSVMVVPDVFPRTSKKDFFYRGCKEYAYLGQKYFTPQKEIIKDILGKSKEYVFIRLISKSSLNYIGSINQNKIIKNLIKFFNQKGFKVLLSSEKECTDNQDDVIVLQPPIEGFHSILKYASFVISEGDTMAREAAVLGTPVIYLGGRKMKIHSYFKDSGNFLDSCDQYLIYSFINKFENLKKTQIHKMFNFDDIDEIMFNKIIKSYN